MVLHPIIRIKQYQGAVVNRKFVGPIRTYHHPRIVSVGSLQTMWVWSGSTMKCFLVFPIQTIPTRTWGMVWTASFQTAWHLPVAQCVQPFLVFLR